MVKTDSNHQQHGAVLVEFALGGLLFFTLIFSMIDLSVFFYNRSAMRNAAQQALELASVIEGLDVAESIDQSGNIQRDYKYADEKIIQKAEELLSSFKLGSLRIRSNSNETINFRGEEKPLGIYLDVPGGDTIAERNTRLDSEPIKITILAKYKASTPFLPELPIVVTEAAYRELRTKSNLPVALDCKGNPITDLSKAPTTCPCTESSDPNAVLTTGSTSCSCQVNGKSISNYKYDPVTKSCGCYGGNGLLNGDVCICALKEDGSDCTEDNQYLDGANCSCKQKECKGSNQVVEKNSGKCLCGITSGDCKEDYRLVKTTLEDGIQCNCEPCGENAHRYGFKNEDDDTENDDGETDEGLFNTCVCDAPETCGDDMIMLPYNKNKQDGATIGCLCQSCHGGKRGDVDKDGIANECDCSGVTCASGEWKDPETCACIACSTNSNAKMEAPEGATSAEDCTCQSYTVCPNNQKMDASCICTSCGTNKHRYGTKDSEKEEKKFNTCVCDPYTKCGKNQTMDKNCNCKDCGSHATRAKDSNSCVCINDITNPNQYTPSVNGGCACNTTDSNIEYKNCTGSGSYFNTKTCRCESCGVTNSTRKDPQAETNGVKSDNVYSCSGEECGCICLSGNEISNGSCGCNDISTYNCGKSGNGNWFCEKDCSCKSSNISDYNCSCAIDKSHCTNKSYPYFDEINCECSSACPDQHNCECALTEAICGGDFDPNKCQCCGKYAHYDETSESCVCDTNYSGTNPYSSCECSRECNAAGGYYREDLNCSCQKCGKFEVVTQSKDACECRYDNDPSTRKGAAPDNLCNTGQEFDYEHCTCTCPPDTDETWSEAECNAIGAIYNYDTCDCQRPEGNHDSEKSCVGADCCVGEEVYINDKCVCEDKDKKAAACKNNGRTFSEELCSCGGGGGGGTCGVWTEAQHNAKRQACNEAGKMYSASSCSCYSCRYNQSFTNNNGVYSCQCNLESKTVKDRRQVCENNGGTFDTTYCRCSGGEGTCNNNIAENLETGQRKVLDPTSGVCRCQNNLKEDPTTHICSCDNNLFGISGSKNQLKLSGNFCVCENNGTLTNGSCSCTDNQVIGANNTCVCKDTLNTIANSPTCTCKNNLVMGSDGICTCKGDQKLEAGSCVCENPLMKIDSSNNCICDLSGLTDEEKKELIPCGKGEVINETLCGCSKREATAGEEDGTGECPPNTKLAQDTDGRWVCKCENEALTAEGENCLCDITEGGAARSSYLACVGEAGNETGRDFNTTSCKCCTGQETYDQNLKSCICEASVAESCNYGEKGPFSSLRCDCCGRNEKLTENNDCTCDEEKIRDFCQLTGKTYILGSCSCGEKCGVSNLKKLNLATNTCECPSNASAQCAEGIAYNADACQCCSSKYQEVKNGACVCKDTATLKAECVNEGKPIAGCGCGASCTNGKVLDTNPASTKYGTCVCDETALDAYCADQKKPVASYNSCTCQNTICSNNFTASGTGCICDTTQGIAKAAKDNCTGEFSETSCSCCANENYELDDTTGQCTCKKAGTPCDENGYYSDACDCKTCQGNEKVNETFSGCECTTGTAEGTSQSTANCGENQRFDTATCSCVDCGGKYRSSEDGLSCDVCPTAEAKTLCSGANYVLDENSCNCIRCNELRTEDATGLKCECKNNAGDYCTERRNGSVPDEDCNTCICTEGFIKMTVYDLSGKAYDICVDDDYAGCIRDEEDNIYNCNGTEYVYNTHTNSFEDYSPLE
ncbi:MAG: TadE family protein [Bdellovibrionota bacterium]|jgi:hypothetical protein